VRVLREDVDALEARIRATPSVVALRLSALAAATGGRAILVVDQLEEVFTHVADATERERFLDAVLGAADDPLEPARVIVTVRDDFLGRIPRLKSLFTLAPLRREAIVETIRGPLRQVGYAPDDPSLVDRMLTELDGGPGELPLLQFACRQLWEARDEGRRLVLASAYASFGGVAGALAKHADDFLASLDANDLRVVRHLLLRLVSPEGTRLVREERVALDGLGPSAEGVLAGLTRARLVVRQRSRDSGAPTLELAHEALIKRWERLVRWLDDAREERRLNAELESAALLWAQRGRRAEETWSGEALATAQHRIHELGLVPSADVLAFLDAGRARARTTATRRRAAALALVILLVTTTVGALLLAREFKQRQTQAELQHAELVQAGSNLGLFELHLEPFDWDPTTLRTAPAAVDALPALAFALHEVDDDREGPALASELVRTTVVSSTIATRRALRVEAPGMPVFLRIDGRGRAGSVCAPSWVRIKALPGWAERQRGAMRVLAVRFPTCEASRAGTVLVPEGPVIVGGPGEPPVTRTEDAEPERRVAAPAFRIDETELSNAAFEPFAELSWLTGHRRLTYPSDDVLPGVARRDHPAGGVDARLALAVCRFWGKRLPTWVEWSKAARGGLVLEDGPNRAPRRLLPWLGGAARPALRGVERACPKSCSVLDDRGTRSPYGVRDLVGNVAEWGVDVGPDADPALSLVLGGGWASDPKEELHTTALPNHRGRDSYTYDTGVRCVSAP
ncbi:formylglycine-generating enzyme family protein, partial [Myxococcota bacterium]|nr:formylglycine-generating enzyme family protein [Myxococcota bacterium]